MWKIWIVFSVFKLSYTAPVDSKDDSSAAAASAGSSEALSCLFMTCPLALCDDIKRYGNNIPKRLQKLYASMRSSIAEGSQDAYLDATSTSHLPQALLYAIPRIRLRNMTGLAAANILRQAPDDEALAMKLASLVVTDSERRAFLEALPYDSNEETGIEGIHLSAGVERELGRAMAIWYPTCTSWQFWQFDTAINSGSPVLANLPEHFLHRITPQVAEKFLYHLKSWRLDSNSNEIWEQHPQHIKRMWTLLALEKWERPHLWLPVIMRDAGYILSGASPEEMETIISFVRSPGQIPMLLDIKFPTLQSRALYDITAANYSEFSSAKSVKKLLPHLLPRQIQPFDPTSVDLLRFLSAMPYSSLPTLQQMLENQLARLIHEKTFPSFTPSSWADEIAKLEHLVHLLPASTLEEFKNIALNQKTLATIFSESITYRQARYLTKNGRSLSFEDEDSIVSGKHHLKALPTSALVLTNGRVIPEHLQKHLLRYIPGQSRALSAELLERVYLDIDDRSLLKSALKNDNYYSILSLLSGRDLLNRFHSITESLAAIASENEFLKQRVRNLPPNIGTMLLAEYRRLVALKDVDGWTLDNLIHNQKHPLLRNLISHLQCVDVELINVADVIPILGYYVRERNTLGLGFPKNMQYCCQKALTRFLKMKSSLRHITDESSGLLNLMEGFEVKAVGGYILSSLPVESLAPSFLKVQMLREIGALPLPELLRATSLGNLHDFAESFASMIPDLHLREVIDMGNLIWFLEAPNVRRIPIEDFRLMMTLKEENDARAPCLHLSERDLWKEFLIQVYGKPYSWTAGTLSLLGDLLYLFDEVELDLIPVTARIEAADILVNKTTFHHLIEWPSNVIPISYYEACVEALPNGDRTSFKTSVRSLLRFYLESSQMLLDTVMSAKSILKIDDQLNAIDSNIADEEAETYDTDSTTESTTEMSSTEATKASDRIKREVKRRRITKRVLNENKRVEEMVANTSRALVMVVEEDQNKVSIHVSESFPRKNIPIKCAAIKMLGMSASWVLDVEDFKSWTDVEVEDCSELLGSLELTTDVRKHIWPRLSKWKENQNLMEVGNLVSVVEEKDLMSLNLSIAKPWALEALAVLSEHVSNDDSLDLIADHFIMANEGLPSLTFGTAVSLGRIVCRISKTKQQKLLLSHPGVFVKVAPILGHAGQKDKICVEQMIEFAKTAFGQPETWTAEDVASLGVIAAGLTGDDWKNPRLKPNAISGLTPAAVSLIPPEVFRELSVDQLSRLAPLSVAAISPAQSSSLSPSQSAVLERVRRQIPDKDIALNRSNGSVTVTASWTTILILIATVVKALI